MLQVTVMPAGFTVRYAAEAHPMYRPLAPCPGCHRHVVATEPACPFCHRVLATALAARPDTSRRLSRAAAFSFAASLTAVGCSSSVSATDAAPNTDVGAGDVPVDRPATDQGFPVDRGTTDTGTNDTGTPDTGTRDTGVLDIGNVAPPYGIPPPEDAGAPDDDGGAMDLYGAPPFDGG